VTAEEALLIAALARNAYSALLRAGGSAETRQAVHERMMEPQPGDLVVEISKWGAPRDPDMIGRLIRVSGDEYRRYYVIEPLHRPGQEQGWQNAVFAAVPDVFPMREFFAVASRDHAS
jgi:hypothetical protein